jgi:hypothetical protein
MKGSELVAHIGSLTTHLDKEEMKEFLDLAEESGFQREAPRRWSLLHFVFT